MFHKNFLYHIFLQPPPSILNYVYKAAYIPQAIPLNQIYEQLSMRERDLLESFWPVKKIILKTLFQGVARMLAGTIQRVNN
jgi:hypothetical protein